ncbi:MAG: TIGR00645 family protein [Limnobacter sp.]|nr:TIGR00645 family protein [Limnobacter sp.]
MQQNSGKSNSKSPAKPIPPIARLIFMSRWMQLPLYLGLIAAQGVYVYHFLFELWHLIADTAMHKLNETGIMLIVLGLIDVAMISNLLMMVIIGGYETFVSRMHLDNHPDQPEWLDHVNASVLKVKLAMAIIGISSIHLLKTFINAEQYDEKTLLAQTAIHIAFLLSAIAIAYCDKLVHETAALGKNNH